MSRIFYYLQNRNRAACRTNCGELERLQALTPLRADLAAKVQCGQTLESRTAVGRPLHCGPPFAGLASLLILGFVCVSQRRTRESFRHVHGIVESTNIAFAIRIVEIGHRDDYGSVLPAISRRCRTRSHRALQSTRRLAAAWAGAVREAPDVLVLRDRCELDGG